MMAGSPARHQIEAEDPATARALERPREIELADGKAKQIRAKAPRRPTSLPLAIRREATAVRLDSRRYRHRRKRHFNRERTIHVP